jgi:2-oxoglutarate dehydrogenase E2 component (dihydrolipoamide succinyltransferase)
MAVEIKVPTLGESVTEATVGKWFKKPGDAIKIDEPLCELETDKVTMEVPAPAAGVMGEIKVAEGATVAVGSVLGFIKDGAGAAAAPAAPAPAAPKPVAAAPTPIPPLPPIAATSMPPAPAARKMLEENGMAAADVAGSGKRGQVLKEDVARAAAAPAQPPASTPALYVPTAAVSSAPPTALRVASTGNDAGREERVKMSRLRQTIARRLKDAQNTAAMLTTFNDVDMSAVMAMRTQYKDLFEKRHGVKLGFMSFFVKACIQALKEVPAVNAELDGQDIIYKNYYHVGVAVGTDKGLVVPVMASALATANSASRTCRAARSPSRTAAPTAR